MNNNPYKLIFFLKKMSESLEYKTVKENVIMGDMAKVICEINDSKDFEIDELSHIILKGTNTRVGYLGDDTFELVNPNEKLFKGYHSKLGEIFNYELLN